MATDYYQTLGLQKNASEEEIQKAYRSLARKYHPDLNPDDETAKKRFQEVQNAFDVLGDTKKRQMYDRYGSNFEQMGQGPGTGGWPGGPQAGQGAPFDFEDLFGAGASGGAGGGFADLFKNLGRKQQRKPEKGADIETEITVPFNSAILGGQAALSIRRSDGSSEELTVRIPAGIEDGKKIRLRGQGERTYGGAQGDLLVTVHVTPHPSFRRRGKSLDVRVPVTLGEAIQGTTIDLPAPHGTIALRVPPRTSSGAKLRLKGQGIRPATGEPGDLYAEIVITLPQDLDDTALEEITRIASNTQEDPRVNLRW